MRNIHIYYILDQLQKAFFRAHISFLMDNALVILQG